MTRRLFRCCGIWVSSLLIALLGLRVVGAQASAPSVFFDDFSYDSTASQAFANNGWHVRSADGGPGIPGATWSPQGVTLADDADSSGNRLIALRSASDGSASGTTQTELFSERKFLYGTYAARVHFSDAPVSGPDGAHLIESFFTISPLRYDLDPDYSELDFEYRPNGGWGAGGSMFSVTSWQTAAADESLWRNTSEERAESLDGWHMFVIQASDSAVDYFVDGKSFAHHVGRAVPVTPMSINFNLWFIGDDKTPTASASAEYVEQIDWVFHAADMTIAPADVEAQVVAYRAAQTAHVDSVAMPGEQAAIQSPHFLG